MSRVVLGVDLGKWQTPATIIALQTKSKAPVWDPVRLCWNQGPGINSVVCWVEAIPLGTSYDAVSRRIWEIAEKLGASEVWMDGTGVGVAVEEMVQQCKPPRLKCILRTNGKPDVSATTRINDAVSSGVARGQSKGVEGLSHWPELRKELLCLDGQGRKKNGPDDLALGLALAVWGLTGFE